MFIQHHTGNQSESTISIIFNPVNFSQGASSEYNTNFNQTQQATDSFQLQYFKVTEDLWSLDEFGDPEVYLMLVYLDLAQNTTITSGGQNTNVSSLGCQTVSYYKLGRAKKGTYLNFKKSFQVSPKNIKLTYETHYLAALSKGVLFGGALPVSGDKFTFGFLTEASHTPPGSLPEVALERVYYRPRYQEQGYQFIKGATVNQEGGLEYLPMLIYADFDQEMIGVTYLAGNHSQGSQQRIIESKMFAMSSEVIGQAFKLECEPERIFNVSADQLGVKDLKPNQVAFSCFYSVIGSFDYLIQYELFLDPSVTQNGTNVFVSSRMAYNIVTPDSFREDYMERVAGNIFLKMDNQNIDAKINNSLASQCPRIVVIYKPDESNYPWAIYSCEDLDLTNNQQLPLIATYYYDQEYIWITKTTNELKLAQNRTQSNLQSGNEKPKFSRTSRLSLRAPVEATTDPISTDELSIISAHTIKNSTFTFLKQFSFNEVNITLMSLEQNIMLTKLGLITQVLQTPFTISFDPSFVWFIMIILAAFSLVLYVQCRNLHESKAWMYLFGLAKLNEFNPENILCGLSWEDLMYQGDDDEDLAADIIEEIQEEEDLGDGDMEEDDGHRDSVSDYDVDDSWVDDCESRQEESSSGDGASGALLMYNFDPADREGTT